jgi:hypothetical protein
MKRVVFTPDEIRAHLVFKWKKKIKFGICKTIHPFGCDGCKDIKPCEKYRTQKMFSGS